MYIVIGRDSLGKIIEDRVLQLSGSNPDYYGSDVNMISAVSAGDLAAGIDQAGEDYIIESRQGRPFIGTSPDDSDPAEVGWGTLGCYLSKGGGCVPLTCFLVLNVAAEALITGSSIWIEHWTSPDEEEYTNNSSSSVFPRRDGLDILHP